MPPSVLSVMGYSSALVSIINDGNECQYDSARGRGLWLFLQRIQTATVPHTHTERERETDGLIII